MTKLKGIDVSVYQGCVDFNRVKADGIDFVILKSGYGRNASQVADNFEINYTKAKAAGLPVGCYHYSYATSVNEAIQEAKACIEILKGKQFEFPVFYDVEESATFRTGITSEIIKAFCNELEKNGYYVGLYMSKSQLMSYVSADVRARYAIWCAQYNVECTYSGTYDMWQYSDRGKVNGINASVDMNYCYKNYDMKALGLNGFKKSESKPVETVSSNPVVTTPSKWTYKKDNDIVKLQTVLNNKGINLEIDGIAGDKTYNAVRKYTINFLDRGELTTWVQNRLNKLGFDCGQADGICGNKTMNAIKEFQKANGLGQGYLGGTDWYYLIK